MNWQRSAMILTAVNLVVLMFVMAEVRPVVADGVTPVLRGRALELVDDSGRVRAEIKVAPAQPTLKMPDGTTGAPETVILRLIDSKGGPNVKLVATEDGSGLLLGGESGAGYAQILARGPTTFMKLLDKSGRQQLIKP
jgi:hypothetical protein